MESWKKGGNMLLDDKGIGAESRLADIEEED